MRGAVNLLAAARCVDAGPGAFGAVRVMVNINQMGQAAGIAAWLALDQETGVADLDVQKLRGLLNAQGAVIL